MPVELQTRQTPGASLVSENKVWRLTIPTGPAGSYRWAQLDDYLHRSRGNFLWEPPVKLSLSARVSNSRHPGTWGFGFWNDPFTASLGLGGMAQRLPALPNAAWFFFASPPNYLSLEDHLPAQGFLASTFCSPRIPSLLLAPALVSLPLLLWPPSAVWLRRTASRLIRQSSESLANDPTRWHHYELLWSADQVTFTVEDPANPGARLVKQTAVSPKGRGGLVIWIDNQYAAFKPNGRLGYGTLPNDQAAWLELDQIQVD